jgi:hypothetical protein
LAEIVAFSPLSRVKRGVCQLGRRLAQEKGR